jgi:hypothetical protein
MQRETIPTPLLLRADMDAVEGESVGVHPGFVSPLGGTYGR